MEFVMIPEDRVGALIGKEGSTKKLIEKKCDVELNIEDNRVEIKGESLNIFNAKPVVKAIARGFSPKKALTLLSENTELFIIDLDLVLSTDKEIKRQKGRVIGRKGKTRKHLEELLRVYISVYGRTISIIGERNSALIAKEAVEKLLSGSPHSSVYSFVERKKSEIRWQ